MFRPLARLLAPLLALAPAAQAGDGDYYLSVPLQGAIIRIDAATLQPQTFAAGLVTPFYGYFGTDGTLYMPDRGIGALLAVSPAGALGLVAGGGLLSSPVTALPHPDGGHVVSDYFSNRVVRVAASGGQSVLAGPNSPGGALLDGPGGTAWDRAGNLYVGNNAGDTIVRVDAAGAVTLFSASPLIRGPGGLAIDGAGNLFVAMYDSHEIVRFRLDTGEAETFASGAAVMNKPNDLKLARSGGLLTTTRFSNLLRIDALGQIEVLFQDGSFGEIDGIAVPEDATPCSGTFLAYGVGTAGSGGITPELRALFSPCPGALLGLEFRRFLGGTVAYLAFGVLPAALPLAGGTLLVNPAPVFALLPIPLAGAGPGDGHSTLQFELPDEPSFTGAKLYLQALAADPGAPGGVSFSNGLEETIGS